jgi:quercetin dioxygenase-like cupin family protein
MYRIVFSNLLALIFLVASGSAALAQPTPTASPLNAPPGPVSHFATSFDVVDAPEQFEQVLSIIDFPGGAWTPSHTPGGALYMTVIQGEISTRSAAPGSEQTFPAGGTITLNAGDYVEVGNATSGNARVIATAILPMGAPLTIDPAGFSNDAYSGSTQSSGVLDSVVHTPRPTTVYHSAIAVERPAGVFAVAHVLLDLEPGVWTPQHIHGGQELVVVTSGEMTLQRHGESQMFATGESWVNASGVVHAAGNDGSSFAQVAVAFLLPAGRPLTTVV